VVNGGVTYIIASTMRTGSYLLCEGLEATERAGHPREVFCPERREDYAGQWQLAPEVPLRDYIRAVLENCATENGVVGMKIHEHHLEPLARAAEFIGEPSDLLRELFPHAKYIHLSRANHRAQAISWYRARATNCWWYIPAITGPPFAGLPVEFDAAELRRLELDLVRQEEVWNRFFGAHSAVEVLSMEYESLSTNYRGEIARVLGFIGEDASVAEELPPPRLARQTDAISVEWERRMDKEFAGGSSSNV
jgi:LPS sulfotransferase NodH